MRERLLLLPVVVFLRHFVRIGRLFVAVEFDRLEVAFNQVYKRVYKPCVVVLVTIRNAWGLLAGAGASSSDSSSSLLFSGLSFILNL